MTARATLSHDGHVARLTLASEDGENRIGAATLAQIAAACAALRNLPDLRALVVQAEGAAFSLGWDSRLLASPDAAALPGDPFGVLATLPVPVIAAVHGDAASGGLELALACDVRIVVATARLAMPEPSFGLLPLAGGTQRLPRLVGRGRALAMLLLGQEIDGATALDWGLAQATPPAGQFAEAVDAAVRTIDARGPIAERFAKEAVSEGIEMPLARALRYETDLTVLLQTTADRAEGVRAFAEKRPPRFENR